MPAQPYDFLRHYTVAEFAALPEDDSAYYELQEGQLIVSPRPVRDHQDIAVELIVQVREQLPKSHKAYLDIDVDLQLPGSVVRIPDLVIVRKAGLTGRLTPAANVELVVEIISPGSVRMDTMIKPLEYADAGIPNLWLIDPNKPITATIFTLVNGDYEESQRAEGSFTVTEPFPLTIDLDALLDD